MEKKYQVFISSTYTDLVEERKYVQDVILSMNHFPVGMELFSAASEEQWEIIKRTIDTSDYYILIIGYRYGSEMDDGVGYTEREYLYAKEKGIPIIAFIKNAGLPVKDADRETAANKKKKLNEFIKKVKKGREVSWWSTKEELGQKVTVSLYKEFSRINRPGWVRLTEIEDLKNKIEKLQIENAALKRAQSGKRDEVPVRKSKGIQSFFKDEDFLNVRNCGVSPNECLRNLKFVDIDMLDLLDD